MVTTRATSRAYVRLPAIIRSGDLVWTGRTRDLSQGGTLVFVEPPYPSGPCTVDLELPSGLLSAYAEVRFTLPNVGVGLQFVNLDDDLRARLDAVVNAAAATFGAWGLVGKYLAEAEPRAGLKLPPSGEMGALASLRASMQRSHTPAVSVELAAHQLHPVGENGHAYKVMFTRPGVVTPEQSDLAKRVSGFMRAVQGKVAAVAPQDAWLKLHAGAQPKPFRITLTTQGTYAAVIVTDVPGAPPRVSLLTLAVGEQIATSLRGTPLFPYFTEAELEEIRSDSVKGQPPSADGAAGVVLEPGRTDFSEYVPFDEPHEAALAETLRQDAQAEVRRYRDRTVTLHPYILLKVRNAAGDETVGVAMHDGRRHCVLQLSPDGFSRVIPIGRDGFFGVMLS
jgi:hypothetical protein